MRVDLGRPDTAAMALVVVDAENVRRSIWPNISPEELVERTRAWAAREGHDLLIVFDGLYSSPLTGEYSGSIPPSGTGTVTGLSGTGLVVVNGVCGAGIAGSFDGTTATLATSWRDAFFLSTDDQLDVASDLRIGTQGITLPNGLAADAGYSRVRSLATPADLASGQYYLFAVTDIDDQVYELDNGNNVLPEPVPMTIESRPAAERRT